MTTTKTRTPFFGGNRFEQIAAIVMTLIVIQTAIITYWYTLAEDANGDAGRDSQIFALQGLGKRTIGNIRVSYDETSAFQSWLELDMQARLAERRGDTLVAAQFRAARDRLPKLSPLLRQPYFEPGQSTTPDLTHYEADTFLVESIALSERFENQSRLKQQWSERASSYTVMLTVLAVTLFLLGISSSSPRFIRRLLFGIGAMLALVVLVWMLVTYIEPVGSLPDEAIVAYAQGVGDAYQENYEQAIPALDDAIELAPNYTNAYLDRAFAKYNVGDLEGTAQDFEAALDNGEAGSEVVSSLGFVYYLLGDFDSAGLMHQDAVESSPGEMWIRANAALNQLASDDRDGAQTAYESLLDDVTRTVSDARLQGKEPPAALWNDFDLAADDLEELALCGTQQLCEKAPPFETLRNPAEMAETAWQLATRLKEYSVALEYTGQAPTATVEAEVEPFLFTRTLTADDVSVEDTELFTATDEPIYVYIEFRGLRDGEQVVLKVIVDGVEDDRLRFVDNYSSAAMGGGDGDVLLPLTTGGVPLSPGEYKVEMYVESTLIQSGYFVVVPESE